MTRKSKREIASALDDLESSTDPDDTDVIGDVTVSWETPMADHDPDADTIVIDFTEVDT